MADDSGAGCTSGTFVLWTSMVDDSGACLLHQMSNGLLAGAGCGISALPLTMQAEITLLCPKTLMAAIPAPPRLFKDIRLLSRGIRVPYPCCVTSNAHWPTSALLLLSCAAPAPS